LAEQEKKKIKLFEVHFAWVNDSLLKRFTETTGIKRRTEWIKECAKEDFDIVLDSPDDIPRLELVIRSHYYEDKGEWLREKMRKAIQKELSLK